VAAYRDCRLCRCRLIFWTAIARDADTDRFTFSRPASNPFRHGCRVSSRSAIVIASVTSFTSPAPSKTM
jgi:hypothetical protein